MTTKKELTIDEKIINELENRMKVLAKDRLKHSSMETYNNGYNVGLGQAVEIVKNLFKEDTNDESK